MRHIKRMQFTVPNCSRSDYIRSVLDGVISSRSSIMQQSQRRTSDRQSGRSAVEAIFGRAKAERDGTDPAEPSAGRVGRARTAARGPLPARRPPVHTCVHACVHTCAGSSPGAFLSPCSPLRNARLRAAFSLCAWGCHQVLSAPMTCFVSMETGALRGERSRRRLRKVGKSSRMGEMRSMNRSFES